MGIVAASLVLGAVSAPAATNLLANGAFEGTGAGSLTGWAGSGGSLALTTGDGGGHAARLAASGTAQAYIYTTTKPVRSVTVGGVYTGGGRLFSASSGQNVCLVIKEVPSGGTATVGSTRQCLTATATWQTFPAVSYTAKTSGDSLTINLLDTAPSAGASFAVDNLTLVSGSGGGGGGDTSAPSVPQGVTASATGSSTVRVGWSPSTDNVGVTGYHVYRSGISVATLGGAATSFQDSGLAPSTQYTYTVDAFDAAGNTSAQSAGAVVTTRRRRRRRLQPVRHRGPLHCPLRPHRGADGREPHLLRFHLRHRRSLHASRSPPTAGSRRTRQERRIPASPTTRRSPAASSAPAWAAPPQRTTSSTSSAQPERPGAGTTSRCRPTAPPTPRR